MQHRPRRSRQWTLRACARLALSMALSSLLGSACAVVAPYERERLARPDMELGRNADVAAGEDHAINYREGSSGATGTSGGGCGCN
jgi:hypothetical protein